MKAKHTTSSVSLPPNRTFALNVALNQRNDAIVVTFKGDCSQRYNPKIIREGLEALIDLTYPEIAAADRRSQRSLGSNRSSSSKSSLSQRAHTKSRGAKA